MANEVGRAFDWDDEIEKDESYVLLSAGDYYFTVLAFTRSNYGGSDKLPPCNMAELTIKVWNESGESSSWKENFILHEKFEWKISEIHRALGLKKHGERLRMKWKEMEGLSGKCKVKVRTYTKKDGSTGTANQVEQFYDADGATVVTTATTQSNMFAPRK